MDRRDGQQAPQTGLRVIAEGLTQAQPQAVSSENRDPLGSIFDRAMRHMVDARSDSELLLRNVTVNGRRTTIRLEPEMWDALAEIARREGYTQTQLCSRIADGQPPGLSFTASVRMFILMYFRAAAHGEASLGQEDGSHVGFGTLR